eukprot:7612237-Ditylum_brightwellii.AAC.1
MAEKQKTSPKVSTPSPYIAPNSHSRQPPISQTEDNTIVVNWTPAMPAKKQSNQASHKHPLLEADDALL